MSFLQLKSISVFLGIMVLIPVAVFAGDETDGHGPSKRKIQTFPLETCYEYDFDLKKIEEEIDINDPYTCGDPLGCGHGGTLSFFYTERKSLLLVGFSESGQVYEREITSREPMTATYSHNMFKRHPPGETVTVIRAAIMRQARPVLNKIASKKCTEAVVTTTNTSETLPEAFFADYHCFATGPDLDKRNQVIDLKRKTQTWEINGLLTGSHYSYQVSIAFYRNGEKNVRLDIRSPDTHTAYARFSGWWALVRHSSVGFTSIA